MPIPSASQIAVFSFTTVVHIGPKTDERKRESERKALICIRKPERVEP